MVVEVFLVISWRYVENLCRKLAKEILEDRYLPEKIVALAKGGLFVGGLISDYLGIPDVECLKVNEGRKIKGERLLVVDDFINTGRTMLKALKLVEGREVRTAALLMLENSEFVPNYLGDYLTDYYWVIFPWNFYKDLSKIVAEILRQDGELAQSKLRRQVSDRGLNAHALEAVFPGKFEEVLEFMEMKGIIKKRLENGRVYWGLVE